MTHYLTKQGLQKIKEELEYMKQVTRKEIIERIAAAKELGDLKENAEYAEAKDEQALVESKILELETALKGAVLIEESHGNHSTVSVGSTVITQCDGSKFTYTIVGSEEADPLSHKISHESPLGKAFLGKKIGETVVVRVPKGDFAYSIVEIQ